LREGGGLYNAALLDKESAMKTWAFAALAFVGLALPIHAHTPLTSSVPAAGSAVPVPVKEIVLEFGGDVRLTALALTDAAGAKKAVADLPTAIQKKFTVAVRDELPPGAYVATWRAVGADTHVVSGEIKFRVAAAQQH
jgi:methionine-rich copper-binding protein CopC